MSRVVRFHRIGGPEVLQCDEVELGAPAAAEVRIRVRTLGLNRAESMFRRGIYPEVPILPAKLGARLAFDPIGGPGVEALVDALGENGVLVPYGIMTADPTPYPLEKALARNLTIHAFTLPFMTRDPLRLDLGKRFVIEGVEAGRLKPIIDRSFAFEEIVEAHRYMESNQQVGKIVVAVY